MKSVFVFASIALLLLASGCVQVQNPPASGNDANGIAAGGNAADGNTQAADGNAGSSAEKCWDGTLYGSCGNAKPNYCNNGQLAENCTKCGCPSGKECLGDGSCGIKLKSCADQNGIICGADEICKGGKIQAADSNNCCSSCQQVAACSDGTQHASCASEKPLYCYNGEISDKCSECGCPAGQNCQEDGSCSSGDAKPIIAKFVFIRGSTQYASNFSVNAGTTVEFQFQIEVLASDDKGVSHIELSDTSYGNSIENDFFSCGGERLCGNTWDVTESIAGTNTFTVKVTDTSNQTVSMEKTITISTYCGNSICESGENSSNCPSDCV